MTRLLVSLALLLLGALAWEASKELMELRQIYTNLEKKVDNLQNSINKKPSLHIYRYEQRGSCSCNHKP